MTNYKEKYFKYKLKYLKLKGGKIINGGGTKFDKSKGKWVPTSKTEYSFLEANFFNKYNIDSSKKFPAALDAILELNVNEKDEKGKEDYIQFILDIYHSRDKLDIKQKEYLKELKRHFPDQTFAKRIKRIKNHEDVTNKYKTKLLKLKIPLEEPVAEPVAEPVEEPVAEPVAEPEAKPVAEEPEEKISEEISELIKELDVEKKEINNLEREIPIPATVSPKKVKVDKIFEKMPPLDLPESIIPIDKPLPKNIRKLIIVIENVSTNDMRVQYLIDNIENYLYDILIKLNSINYKEGEIDDWIETLTTLLNTLRDSKNRGYEETIELLEKLFFLQEPVADHAK